MKISTNVNKEQSSERRLNPGPAEAILKRAENFLDYLRCYICLKSCKCKPKEESNIKIYRIIVAKEFDIKSLVTCFKNSISTTFSMHDRIWEFWKSSQNFFFLI